MALEFTKCCYCINLRTGCLIIGYLNLIGAILMALLTIFGLAAVVRNYEYFYVNEYSLTQEHQQEYFFRMLAIMVPVITALLVFFIHFLGFTIVLLVGLHQHKRGHVKAYLVYALIIIVLYITCLALLYVFFNRSHHITAGQIATHFFTSTIPSIYFLLVIRSYYLKMDDPANNPAIYNTV